MPSWQDVLDIDGFSSAKTRRLLNDAVATMPSASVLEVGSYLGSTAVAMCYGNDVQRIHLVDNYSEFGNTRQYLAATAERFGLPATIHDLDFFSTLPDGVFGGTKFTVYHYDGPHDEDRHAEELAIAWPHLADSFLYIVDDYSWDQVHRGCERGMKAMRDRMTVTIRERHESSVTNDRDGYWNGVMLAWCEKK